MLAKANIQSIPSNMAFLAPPLSANYVPSGTKYNPLGRYTLAVVTGAVYIWTGTGGENCYNDGNLETSGADFIAKDDNLLLTGSPGDFIFATVVRAFR